MPDGGFSDAQEKVILEWYFTTTGGTAPPSFFVGLFTAQLSDDGSDIAAKEISYTGSQGGYARQPIARNEWVTPVETGDPSYLSNANPIEFDTSNEDTNPLQTATHWGILLTLNGVAPGDLLFSGTIMIPTTGLAILNGVKPQFAQGTLRPQLGSETLTPT